LAFFFLFFVFSSFFFSPRTFFEYQNFLEANSLVTPTHIQPEWYFLPAYAILRAIPKKLGGVIGLAFFILILFIIPLILKNQKNPIRLRNSRIGFFFQIFYWIWIFNFFFLIWVGACPVEYPFLQLSRVGSFLYFSFFFLFFNTSLLFL